MIIMCFKKHLILCDDPLFLGGKDFGHVSRQNVIMIMYLTKPCEVTFRHRLHGRGFQSKRFHDLETASKATRFQRVYTGPIQPLNPTVYVKAISFSGLCASSILDLDLTKHEFS